MPAAKIFSKGSYLAVLGENDEFWLCKLLENVTTERKKFNVRWLEELKCNFGKGNRNFHVLPTPSSVEIESVICQVNL